jgi:peptide/nickel transport system substrate-binding protein
VREALMFAVDRQGIVDTLVKLNDPEATVLGCGFIALPSIGPWCHGVDGTPFARFGFDPGMVARILEREGYTMGDDGYFQKDGKDLTIEWSTSSGIRRREQTQILEIERARSAGIKLVVRNFATAQLFDHFARGDYGIGEGAAGVGPDPSIEATFGCDQFPTAENGYSGSNYIRWCDQEATDLMNQGDRELDPGARLALMQKVYAIQARDFIGLPLYALPVIAAWRTDRIAGPIGQWNSSFLGLFWNMDRWYCVRPGACG